MIYKLTLSVLSIFILLSASAGPSVEQTRSALSHTWDVEYIHIFGKMNGQPVFDNKEVAEEGDAITFRPDGTLITVHEGKEQTGRYKLHSGTVLEILDHEAMVDQNMPEQDIPGKYDVLIEDNVLTLSLDHALEENGMIIEMEIFIQASR